MAKVKQLKIRLELDPEHLWKESVVEICYNATDRNTTNYRRPIPPESERFYILLPKVIADALGFDRVKDKNQDEVFKRFKEVLERFKKLRTETNKVILYEFELEPHPNAKPERFRPDWITGLKIEIWAGTYIETIAIAGDGVKRYSYEPAKSSLSYPGQARKLDRGSEGKRFDKQIPWTEQNVRFFVWVQVNISKLIVALAGIEEPTNLIDMVNSGRLLPLRGAENGE